MSESDCETTYCLKLLHCWLHFSDLEAASVCYAVCGLERTVSVFEHLEIRAQTGCWSPESVLDGVCDLEPRRVGAHSKKQLEFEVYCCELT